MKKIEELTLDEAVSKIAEINHALKLFSAKIASENVALAKLKTEKSLIREQKKKALGAVQDKISKEKNPRSKERLRNQKKSGSKSWDNQISSKDKEINKIQEGIATLRKKKADGSVILSLIKTHIKNLKQ